MNCFVNEKSPELNQRSHTENPTCSWIFHSMFFYSFIKLISIQSILNIPYIAWYLIKSYVNCKYFPFVPCIYPAVVTGYAWKLIMNGVKRGKFMLFDVCCKTKSFFVIKPKHSSRFNQDFPPLLEPITLVEPCSTLRWLKIKKKNVGKLI